MSNIIIGVLCFIGGTVVGLFVACLCVAAGQADRRLREIGVLKDEGGL